MNNSTFLSAAFEEYQRGDPLRAVARRNGVSPGVLRRALVRAGVEIRVQGMRDRGRQEQAIRLYGEGRTLHFIARQLRVAPRTVGRLIKASGIQRPRGAVSPPPQPFPEHLDREAFGHWLSGFTDGEGCFYLKVDHARSFDRSLVSAEFKITLRADDRPILELVRAFWGCGRIARVVRKKKTENPQARLVVFTTSDLAKVVIPHFEQFPLRAKKARDYLIWKQAVLLKQEVQSRPVQGYGGRSGFAQRWKDAEWELALSLAAQLKEQRQFR